MSISDNPDESSSAHATMQAQTADDVLLQDRRGPYTDHGEPRLVPDRLPGLDAARILAAAAVIWLHTAILRKDFFFLVGLVRFAVPFFAASAVLIMGMPRRHKTRTTSWPAYAASRLMRIYLPFLAWTAIYLLFRDIKHLIHPASPPLPFGPYLLLLGSTGHLWFLPFILCICIACFPLANLLSSQRWPAFPLSLILAIAGIATALTPTSFPFIESDYRFANQAQYLLDLSWHALPAVFWGLALIPFISKLCGPSPIANAVPLLCIAGWATTALLLVVGKGNTILLANVGGILVLLAAMRPGNSSITHFLSRFGSCAYGVYLVHIVILTFLEAIFVRSRATMTLPAALFLFITTFLASLAITWYAKSSPRIRLLFP